MKQFVEVFIDYVLSCIVFFLSLLLRVMKPLLYQNIGDKRSCLDQNCTADIKESITIHGLELIRRDVYRR